MANLVGRTVSRGSVEEAPQASVLVGLGSKLGRLVGWACTLLVGLSPGRYVVVMP